MSMKSDYGMALNKVSCPVVTNFFIKFLFAHSFTALSSKKICVGYICFFFCFMFVQSDHHLTLSLSAVHTRYTPETSNAEAHCSSEPGSAGVLLCRSLHSYFKRLYLLNHSSNLIHPHINLKTIEYSIKWVCLDIKLWFCCNTVLL